jgi:hypothetical protein
MDEMESLERETNQPLHGIRRAPHYVSDWTEGHNAKTTASIFFMFFTSIAPAITFAELLDRSTGKIGVVEVCLSSCLSGCIFSIFGGQPLVIVGVTGPVTILTISIYGMAKALGIDFLKFYAWAQIWAGLMHMAAAAAGWCAAIKYVTNFSCHTFGLLIATIYAVTGATGIARYYTRSQSFAACLMETILALGTTLVSLYLANATNWTLFNAKVRTVVSDYAPTFAIVLMTIISLIGRADDLGEDLTRLDVPRTFGTTHGRTWFLNPFELEGWAIALALVPGTIILILFIFDHNVSSIMAQSKEFNLKKGSAYHLDFFVLGICIVCTGILGIPPCNGLIPQAPLHTKSLCVVSKVKRGSKTVDVVDRTYEQRYTNLAQAAMTGVVCARPLIGVLGKIPNATLDGLFLFMALSSLPGNELWDRVKLVVCEKRLRESPKDWYAALDFSTIASFTRLQFSVAFLIFFVTLTPIAMTFPLFIAALVYIRTKILPKYYDAAVLELLDPLIDLAPDDAADRSQHPSTHNLLALEAEMRAIEGEARALESARAAAALAIREARAATPPFDGDDDAKAKHDSPARKRSISGSGDDAA